MSKKRKEAEKNVVYVTVGVPVETFDRAHEILSSRGLDLAQAINAFLVTMVTSSQRRAAVGLTDAMPIGKAKGLPMETLIRLEPSYVAWLLENVESFKLKPDAHDLLLQMLQMEKA